MIVDPRSVAARLSLRRLAPLLVLSLLLCAATFLTAAAQTEPPGESGFGQLSFIDQVGAPVRAVVARATYAYLAEGRYLTILDVADPALPVVVRRVLMPETVQDLAVASHYVYVADGASGLRVVDVRNPAKAREVGAYTDREGLSFNYIVAGDGYLYLVDDAYGTARPTPPAGKRILAFDLAQPATPRLAGVFDVTSVVGSGYYFGITGLTIGGRYLYMPTSNLGGDTLILDVANPALPVFVEGVWFGGRPLAVAVAGDYLYAATGPWGLYIYPRTPPAQPVEIGH